MRKLFLGIKKVVKPLKLHRFKFFGTLNKKIVAKIKTNTATIDGHQMLLDSHDSLNLSIDGVYEIEQTNYIKSVLKPGDFVLDIGANIGYYSLIIAKKIGPNGKVFCFEPDPGNFEILSKNISQNNYTTNSVLFNNAVSNENSKLKLYISELNSGDHRTYSSENDRNFIEIDALKIDDIPELTNVKIKLIKMDIQGWEMYAVNGMRNLILNSKPIVISEFWPIGFKMSNTNPDEYFNFFEENGFNLFIINERGIEATTRKKLYDEYTAEKRNFTSVVFIHKS